MNKQRLPHRIAVLALAGFISPLPAFAQDSAKTASLAGEAIAAKENGDLVTAKAKLEELLKINPADESAKALLADVNKGLLAGADAPKTVTTLDKIAEENLNLFREVDAAALEAASLARKGNPEGAVQLLDQASAALPDNTAGQVQKDRLTLLKNSILAERDSKPAGGSPVVVAQTVSDITRLNKESVTDARRYISQARAMISDGRFSEAAATLDKAEGILPVNETATTAREELKSARGKLFEARYAAAIDKRDMTAARGAVEGYEAVAGTEDSRARSIRADYESKLNDPHFKAITDVSPDFAVREKKANEILAKARAQYLYGDYLGALESYKDVLQYQPLNTEAKSFSIRIRELLHDKSGRYNADITRTKLMEDVDMKWATAESFDKTTNVTAGVVEDNPVLKRMKSIKLNQVTIRDTELDKAIETLMELSLSYDKDGKGVNMTIIDPEHKNPHVTLVLRDLPLNQVLDQVLRSVNYSYSINESGVVEIRPYGGNTDVETDFFSLSPLQMARMTGTGGAAKADAGGSPFGGGGAGAASGGSDANAALLRYFRSIGIEFSEEKNTGLSYDGTSQLVVTNNRRTLDRIRNILRRYSDVKQVNIESKFIDVTQGTLNQIASNWTVSNTKTVNGVEVTQLTAATGNRTLDSAFRTQSGGTSGLITSPDIVNPASVDVLGNVTPASTTAGLNVSIPNNAPSVPNGTNYGSSNTISAFNGLNGGANPNFNGSFFSSFGIGGYEIGLYVQALEEATGSDLMAAPSLTVTTGTAANIKVAQLLRYPESYSQIQAQVSQSGGGSLTGTGGNNASVAITAGTPQDFTTQEVGVVMEVTPTVRDDNETIELELKPKITEFEGFVEYGGTSVAIAGGTVVTVPSGFYQPVFSVRSVETKVIVYDGATVIIGGLTREEVKTVHDKVPVLGDLPLVGKLFQSNGKTSTKRNLMIFVTANMISPTGSTSRTSVGGVRNGTTFSNPTLSLPSGPVYRSPVESKGDK